MKEKKLKVVKVTWEWPGETLGAWVAESQVNAWVAALKVTGSENIEVNDR